MGAQSILWGGGVSFFCRLGESAGLQSGPHSSSSAGCETQASLAALPSADAPPQPHPSRPCPPRSPQADAMLHFLPLERPTTLDHRTKRVAGVSEVIKFLKGLQTVMVCGGGRGGEAVGERCTSVLNSWQGHPISHRSSKPTVWLLGKLGFIFLTIWDVIRSLEGLQAVMGACWFLPGMCSRPQRFMSNIHVCNTRSDSLAHSLSRSLAHR